MAKKEETKMAPTSEVVVGDVNPTLAAVAVKVQAVKQPITVTDLSTGDDSAKLTLNYNRYTAPDYDKGKHGPDETAFYARLMELATALVNPVSAQIDALLYRATQDAYQAAKVTAYAAGTPGQYLSPELKSAITMVVKQSGTRYADASNSDAFNSWKAAFTSQVQFDGKSFDADQVAKRKAGADRVLATAQALSDSGADAF